MYASSLVQLSNRDYEFYMFWIGSAGASNVSTTEKFDKKSLNT